MLNFGRYPVPLKEELEFWLLCNGIKGLYGWEPIFKFSQSESCRGTRLSTNKLRLACESLTTAS